MTSTLLRVDDLHACVEIGGDPHEVIRGLDLEVAPGEVHVITGDHRSGASALGHVLMGSPRYVVTHGSISLDGDDVTHWPPEERSKAGMFCAFVNPPTLPGVSMLPLLGLSVSTRIGREASAREVRRQTVEWSARLDLDPGLLDRTFDSLAADELRSLELLQIAVLQPALSIVDLGSDLDIGSVRSIAHGLRELRTASWSPAFVLLADDRDHVADVGADGQHTMVEGRLGRPPTAWPNNSEGSDELRAVS